MACEKHFSQAKLLSPSQDAIWTTMY